MELNLAKMFRPKKTEMKVVLLNREPTTLRLHEWQGDKALVSSAQKVFANNEFRLMLQVLENEHPGFNVFLQHNIEERAVEQSRAEGYTMAISNLRAMCKLVEIKAPIEETFGTE